MSLKRVMRLLPCWTLTNASSILKTETALLPTAFWSLSRKRLKCFAVIPNLANVSEGT